MEQLIDGDLASNNGGWQWSASTGVDPCPYFRIFNPYSQSPKVSKLPFHASGHKLRFKLLPNITGGPNRRFH